MSDMKKTTPSVSDNPNALGFGFTPFSEMLNGRLAMIGFLAVILIEAFSGRGVLHFWGIL